MQAEFEIQRATTSTSTPGDDQFQRWVEAVPAMLDRLAGLTIRIVDEPEAQRINREYRKRDYATNVLSFPAELPPELELPLLGDLVICAPVVARESAEQNKALEAHWAHMVLHGTLHLLGYDHIDDDEAEAMEALETRIITELGYSAPYADREV